MKAGFCGAAEGLSGPSREKPVDWLAASKRKRNDNHSIKFSSGKALGKVKNLTGTWGRFCQKFEEPSFDNGVTYAEYLKLPQEEQLRRKSAPGYVVGAHFNDGRRKLSHIGKKYLLSFDMDEVTAEQMDEIEMGFSPLCDYEFLRHTTRKHCPEDPRWRVHMPVSRAMTLEESHAVTRILAPTIFSDPEKSMKAVDAVSHRQAQVSFMPSRSKNQEYRWERNEGRVLDVDEILDGFDGDWHDETQLPRREDETGIYGIDPNKKAEDPLTKPGLVGAFCRCFTIEEAIAEFIPETYARVEGEAEERYSYLGGTSANGAICYDGKWLYSWHASDPAGDGHIQNAFDLVRIHKFGHLDEKARADTSPGNMPSWKKMSELADSLPSVKEELIAGRMADFDDDFADDEDDEDDEEEARPAPKERKTKAADLDDDDDEDETADDEDADEGEDEGERDITDSFDDDDEDEVGGEDDEKPAKGKAEKKKGDRSWLSDLRVKASGEIEPVLNNAALIVYNDARIGKHVGYNEFTHDPIALGQIRDKVLPLPTDPIPKGKTYREWRDTDDIALRFLLSSAKRGYSVDMSQLNIQQAVVIAGKKNPVHPVKDYLKACHEKWLAAGRPNSGIDRLPQDYLGCKDDALHRESSWALMVAAVARIMEPGCEFHLVTIITGEQGSRKSSFWKVLANDLFGELSKQIDKPDRMIESMKGRWFLEMGEMAVTKRTESVDLKEFIARSVDTHRLAYAQRVGEYPRQSVLVGTSNEDDFLTDPTGNRRYVVWTTKHTRHEPIDTERLEKKRDMLWGQAYQAYVDERKEKPYGALWLDLRSKEAIDLQNATNEKFRKETATEVVAETVENWLEKPVPAYDALLDADGMATTTDDTPMLRNVVSARQVFDALSSDPTVRAYRGMDVRSIGKALALVPGWKATEGRKRLFGEQSIWYYRKRPENTVGGKLRLNPKAWIVAPKRSEVEDDDLDGLLD